MKNKQNDFLVDCLEYLEDVLGGDDKRLFLENCVSHILDKGAVAKSEFRELAPNGIDKDPRTYLNWLDSFVLLLQEHKHDLWGRCNSELTKFPMLKKLKGGGAGNETRFELVPEDMNSDELMTKPKLIKSDNEADLCNYNSVVYRYVKLKNTPWYLKVSQPFFDKPRSRKIFVFTLLAYYPLSFLGLAWLVGTNFSNPISESYWVIFVAAFYFYITPSIRNILSISVSKLTLLDHVFQPMSAVCISEVRATEDIKRVELLPRKLKSVVVEADCPICKDKHGVEGSVLVERVSLFNRRIIGKCLNNPREHIYTFDKDLMAGERCNSKGEVGK